MTAPNPEPQPENPYAPPAAPAPGRTRPRMGLGWWMGLVAVVAVGMALAVAIPGVGILMLILTTPAFLRTGFAATRRRGEGRPMSAEEVLTVFAFSLVLVPIIGVAAIIAFGITCLVGYGGGEAIERAIRPDVVHQGFDDISAWGFWSGWACGLTVALLVIYSLGKRTWKYGEDPK